MFIQIIQGAGTRQEEVRALLDEWRRELSPSATGWLGGTYGFTDDGQLMAVVRFESRDAAAANSSRPEQGAWAERLAALMDGPLEFHDSDDVTLLMDGGSDRAGFVQVIARSRREHAMLMDAQVTANIPAADLGRAGRFYEDTLGLGRPAAENPGGLVYRAGDTAFHLYESEHAGKAGHTIAQFHVADVGAEVRDLEAKGVVFERYEMPGVSWDGAVAEITGLGHAAWFRDSEDNVLCLDDEAAV